MAIATRMLLGALLMSREARATALPQIEDAHFSDELAQLIVESIRVLEARGVQITTSAINRELHLRGVQLLHGSLLLDYIVWVCPRWKKRDLANWLRQVKVAKQVKDNLAAEQEKAKHLKCRRVNRMAVKSFFRPEKTTTFQPQKAKPLAEKRVVEKRELWPDEQRDTLTSWEREQIAADRAERLRQERERAAELAARESRVLEEARTEARERLSDEKIDESFASLCKADKDKLDRLVKQVLKNQGIMGAAKMRADAPAIVRTRREILRNLAMCAQSLDDINEYE